MTRHFETKSIHYREHESITDNREPNVIFMETLDRIIKAIDSQKSENEFDIRIEFDVLIDNRTAYCMQSVMQNTPTHHHSLLQNFAMSDLKVTNSIVSMNVKRIDVPKQEENVQTELEVSVHEEPEIVFENIVDKINQAFHQNASSKKFDATLVFLGEIDQITVTAIQNTLNNPRNTNQIVGLAHYSVKFDVNSSRIEMICEAR